MDSRCLLLLAFLPLSPSVMAEEDAPDLALLEFLGDWEDADGEWIDPLQLLDERVSEEDRSTPEKERAQNTEVTKDD